MLHVPGIRFVDRDEFGKFLFEKFILGLELLHAAENLFDKPEEFFNLDKLRRAIQLDRRLTLREIIEKIFGGVEKFKSKDELLDEELAKFISIHKPDAGHMPQIRLFFKAYITDSEIRDIVEKREFNRFATNAKLNMADYRALNSWREIIPDYVKDYVSLNQFMS